MYLLIVKKRFRNCSILVSWHYLDITSNLVARIITHAPKEYPYLEEEGINVSPGFEPSIKVKQMFHRRLKAPHTIKCIDYEDNPEVLAENQRECI